MPVTTASGSNTSVVGSALQPISHATHQNIFMGHLQDGVAAWSNSHALDRRLDPSSSHGDGPRICVELAARTWEPVPKCHSICESGCGAGVGADWPGACSYGCGYGCSGYGGPCGGVSDGGAPGYWPGARPGGGGVR